MSSREDHNPTAETKQMSELRRVTRARQRAETALTVERNFVSSVLDTVGALIVVFDTAGRIVRFNRACEIISGYQSSDLIGKFAWEKLIPKEEIPEYIDNFQRIRSGQFPTTYENYWLSADGVRRRISWSATAMLDSTGEVAFVIATGIDVTVQRVTEEAIRVLLERNAEPVDGQSLRLNFKFPEELRASCEQYLMYFGQFLEDLGIKADSVVREDSSGVLFTVTPRDKSEALDKIREALEYYLQIPGSRAAAAAMERTSEIALLQLTANVAHLKAQFALALATIQAKDAALSSQSTELRLLKGAGDLRIFLPPPAGDTEPLIDDLVSVKKVDYKGLEFNLPELVRRLKRKIK